MLKINISLREPVHTSRIGFKRAYRSLRIEYRNIDKAQEKIYKSKWLIGAEMDEISLSLSATRGERTKALCSRGLYEAVVYAHIWRTYGQLPQETTVKKLERRRFINHGYKFKRCLKEGAC